MRESYHNSVLTDAARCRTLAMMGEAATTQGTHPDPPPPHPVLSEYYDSAADKRAYLTSIFDETAADYDRVEKWFSMGSGRWYRRQALLRGGLKRGMRVLDVAVGTGLVAREALAILSAGAEKG